jgi:RNA polymerase-associated protein CTR9
VNEFGCKIKLVVVELIGTALMEEPLDISYYLGSNGVDSTVNLDVPLSNGEIVTINLVEELPDDPQELIGFLQGERCDKKYWFTIATAYIQAKKLPESLMIVETALNTDFFNDDDKISFHSYLSWLYLKFVAYGFDKEEYIKKASNEIKYLGNIESSNKISNLLSKACLYLFQDKIDDSLNIFDKLLKIDANNCFALMGKAQIILNKSKNYNVALKSYQQVLILNPLMQPDPRIGIGICFKFLKDERMALKSWHRALEINPNNYKAKILLNLAKFNSCFTSSTNDELFLKNYQDCMKMASSLYDQNPTDSVILLVLVSYYFSKQNYDLVEKIITKIVNDITGNVKVKNVGKISNHQSNILSQCLLWSGKVAFAKGDFTQSQKYFNESIKFNENNLQAKLGLGQSQINRGSLEDAIMTYESILKTNPKCLEVNYSLGVLYSKHKSRRKQEQAISILERYLRLANNRGIPSRNSDETTEFMKREPVALNAYLILSKLYEPKDIGQSLTYLTKAIESRKQINMDAPLEVYNNIGVFNFIRDNTESTLENFEIALKKLDDTSEFKSVDGDVLMDLPNDLKITVNYNLARAKESVDLKEAIEFYEQILKECPNYFSAKLRLLFLDSVVTNKLTKEEIKQEIEALLASNASQLEIRSFYGWFVKNFGKKLGLKPDADTTHQKDTLVQYDSHDCYALISLANIYCIMARDIKTTSSQENEKRKKYYIRAIELFTKVLSIDCRNVYAAQGLAISYIENKELHKGLDILRKIRDSLNDISVYLNLGHVLVDLKNYSKGIENYEIALGRFTDGTDSRILSFLGRSWFLRGISEKSLPYLKKSIEYTELALKHAIGTASSIRFNLAYVQFQIAEFITKIPINQRNIDDIEKAIIDLQSGIETLNALASDDEKHPPYPKSELKARATLGESTLLNRLNTCLEETKVSVNELNEKLEIAKKSREEEMAKRLKEEEEQLLAKKLKEEELAKERAKLQEEAQKWAEEARMDVIEESDQDDNLFNEENDGKDKKKSKNKSPAKKGKKKKAKKKIADSDDEASAQETDYEDGNGNANGKKKSDDEDMAIKSKTKTDGQSSKTKRKLDDDEQSSKSKKKRPLSKETIEDSDEGLDGLFE